MTRDQEHRESVMHELIAGQYLEAFGQLFKQVLRGA